MTTWTVVTRKTGRGQFQKTGFEGTWGEASDYAQTLSATHADVYITTTEDTTVRAYGASGRVSTVKIAPTREERAAAKAEAERVERIAKDLLDSWTKDYLVRDARAILGVERTPYGAAVALAQAGWDREALARRHS